MRQLLRSAALITTCLSTSAAAEDSLVVVELFTSQGCSSCPPADDMLADLSERDNVIAMALHVDYWDYIGWADDFANPEHTRRQQNYARAAGHTTIYTPQFVVAGQDLVIGARGMDLADAIKAHGDATLPVAVSMTRDGDAVRVSAEMSENDSGDAGPYVVQLAQILPDQTVDIHRGENAGRTITYTNVVSALEVLHQWDGAAPLSLEATVTGELKLAVIVQSGTNGPVVGAAKLD